jgi:hypothetical protein
MIDILPEVSEKTSAIIEVSPNDRACSKKQCSQLCGIVIAAYAEAAKILRIIIPILINLDESF